MQIDKQLAKDLDKATKKIIYDSYKGLVSAAAKIELEVKKEVPVDHGRLKSSYHIENSRTSSFNYKNNNGESFDGGLNVPLEDGELAIGSHTNYAENIETFGGKNEKGKDAVRNAIDNVDLIDEIKRFVKK